jgi:hypothetical protein
MFIRKLQNTLLNTVSNTWPLSASMNPYPSSSPTVYTTNFLSPTASIYPSIMTPSPSSTVYILNYLSPTVTNYPFVITPSESPSEIPSEPSYSLNPCVYVTPTPTVYSLSTPHLKQQNINEDDIIIQKKYIGLYIGLNIFLILCLLFWINSLYRKNKKLNKYIDSKKEYIQQPIGRVRVKNIFTSS